MAQQLSALSVKQERKLVDYLDAEFLSMTRGYKKRSEPTTHLPTLSLYLEAASKILGTILQIPPVDPSTSLRTSYLLHLTNDVLNCVTGYAPTPQTIVDLLDWLDDLDQAWLAVLRAQVWDPTEAIGVDLILDADDVIMDTIQTSPVSQTEKTRLRSLVLGGVETFEEWLYGDTRQQDRDALDDMGLQEKFDEVFARTMDELGGFGELMLERLEVKESSAADVDMMSP